MDARLELDGLTVISGGQFLLGAGSSLEFDATTGISGGIFAIPTTGNMRLDGAHTLSGGSYVGLGTLRLNGQTTIAQAVTIDCAILDFDGIGAANKQVTLNSDLTINSGQLDTNDNTFNSTLNINGQSSLLRVDGVESWTMAGTLNHDTGTPFTFPSIDGAPFTMSGTTVIDGGTRWDAQATITGGVSLAAADDRLALGSELPNRIEGGSITGLGVLRAFNTHLSGYGEIATGIDFVAGASLLADDGVLELSGPFSNVPLLIGTADADGTLVVVNQWTLTEPSVLELVGGSVTGEIVTNESTIRGHGLLMPKTLINNGTISASGGETLLIDTMLAPDLDGFAFGPDTVALVQGHTVEAIDGDITVTLAPFEGFDGSAYIAPGRSISFLGGWQLGANGILQMTGNTASSPASLEGANSVIAGQLTLDDHVRIASPASFNFGSATTLADTDTVLRLEGDSSMAKGAVISGPGAVVVGNGNTLALADGSTISARLVNENGSLQLGSAIGAGRAMVASYSQLQPAALFIDILGAPASDDWDQLVVSGGASLAGKLVVTFDVPAAQAGDVWKVLSAGSLSGSFDVLNASGVPAGHILQKIETADGVYLKLATNKDYAKWAAEVGLPEGQGDGPGDDPDGDRLSNALEMFLGGNPLVSDIGILPPLKMIEIGGVRYLSLSLPLARHNVPGDLIITVTQSTDLSDWSVENVVVEGSDFDPLTCIETRIYRSVFPFASLPREFLRIEVLAP